MPQEETDMKPWQQGIPMDILLGIEAQYKQYNEFSMSPFSAVKKHKIAASLSSGEHQHVGYCRYDLKRVRSRSKINMYQNVTIGEKQPGDRVITNLTFVPDEKASVSDHLASVEGPCWLYTWSDWNDQNEVAYEAGFKPIGTKITTFAEIQKVWFKDGGSALFDEERKHPDIDPLEYCSIDRIAEARDLSTLHCNALAEKLKEFDLSFTDHYSNYNAKHSWSALSLRGYTPDPAFITKPEEMNKKWLAEHEDVKFHLQDTYLRDMLPVAEYLIGLLPGQHHRIRLMKLSPGGGELQRHTDLVDPDAGVAVGQLMRFHIPITTNPGVTFTTWGNEGYRKDVHMAVGEIWHIDTRKPHAAINTGNTDRIHLVMDVVANDELRKRLAHALGGIL